MTTTRKTMAYAVRSAIAVGALALVAACGGSGGSDSTDSTAAQSGASSGSPRTLTVFAAASLQKPFKEIGRTFEQDHPGVTVKLSFGGSSTLVAQLTDGAPGDVLATANESTMGTASKAALVDGEPKVFATNTLNIVVPKDNPARIASLADLAKPGAKVVLCAPAVPCGAAAVSVEKAAHIDIKPVSEEQAVTDVLGKVRSGEADAGLVYVTDVTGLTGAAAEVTGIDFAEAESAINRYPIAALKDAADPTLADEFVSAVTSQAGQKVLREAGFGAP